jgi:hypothetical protein
MIYAEQRKGNLTMLLRWLLVGLGLVVVALLLALWWSARRWGNATTTLVARLRVAPTPPRPPAYSTAELTGLPPPVARYFRSVLRDGQPIIKRARVTWQGEFNMGKPGQPENWKPFTATQEFVPGAPGFVWDARIAQAPGLAVFVRDGFVDGGGSMQGAILGLITVVDARGTPTLAAGALQRYLGEATWFPTALLPGQGVTWTPIDDTRARATLTGAGITVSLEFRFDADGLSTGVFTPERYYDDGKNPPHPLPWQARNLRWEERHGIKIPAESVVEWLFPAGPFAYWRGKPVEVEYEYITP